MPMPDDELHRIYAAVTPDIAEVLHLLAKRYNRPEIADATGLSPSTVRNYIERIEDLAKLDQRGLRVFWADGGEQGYLAWLAERLERGTGELGA